MPRLCRRLEVSDANTADTAGGKDSLTAAADRPPLGELTNSPPKGSGRQGCRTLQAQEDADGRRGVRQVFNAAASEVAAYACAPP